MPQNVVVAVIFRRKAIIILLNSFISTKKELFAIDYLKIFTSSVKIKHSKGIRLITFMIIFL
jgi:hypothetical protein